MANDQGPDHAPKVPAISATDLTLALAQELAKQLPVKDIYQDGVSAPLKETGGLLTDVVKTIRLALAPIQLTAALQDHLKPFIERAFSRVKDEDKIAPAPQILGPILEGKKFEPDDTPIDQMFSELLSRACDRTKASQAHPSYPALIRSLSSDEALLLKTIADSGEFGSLSWIAEYKLAERLAVSEFENIEVVSELSYPGNIGLYLRRLKHLDLIVQQRTGEQEALDPDPLSFHYKVREVWKLSLPGEAFISAVTPVPSIASG